MIEIISHRGFWKKDYDQNTADSFTRSFQSGFGVETDIRDLNGDLVISHDMPKNEHQPLTLDSFFELYKKINSSSTLALNIKSDGLPLLLKDKITKYHIKNYFVFDMSIPDMVGFIQNSLNCYTRQSELEKTPALYQESSGVWLDELYSTWITEEIIEEHLKNNKKVCIVSPELHGRSFAQEWTKYKHMSKENPVFNITICTDYPDKARNFFEH
jgi:hypothetical protein